MSSMAVFCPCREPGPLGPEKLPVLIDRIECYFGVNTLLFCPNCVTVRCPFCTDIEPVSWYCSACLMETTKQAARAASNRCMRNCLRCPRCSSNALLKPAQTEDRLEVECSSAACGWKYKGTFLKPVKDTQPLTVAQQVRVLLEQPLRSVLEDVRKRFPDKPKSSLSVVAVPEQSRSLVDAVDPDCELPHLVPLRAKLLKKCRACETCLVDPTRQPAQATFTTKSVARDVLPCVEAYRIGSEVKLLVRNFGEKSLDVHIASPDADTTILSPQILVPPLSVDGFPAPLFLVERETTRSRQAFMSKDNQSTGPGWAVSDLQLPGTKSGVRLFMASKGGADEGNSSDNRLGAWVHVPVVTMVNGSDEAPQ